MLERAGNSTATLAFDSYCGGDGQRGRHSGMLAHRGGLYSRLMSSSCVAAAALGAFSGAAQAEDGGKWQGHAEKVFRPSTNRIGGSLEAFIPLGQDEDSLFFLDARQGISDQVDFYGNWGLGVRQIFSPNLILGGYVYSDATRKDGNSFFAGTAGVEAITPNFDARFNFHFPISGAKTSGGENSTTLSIIGNRLVEETLNNLMRDKPMWGFDTEVGVKLPVSLTQGDDLRLYAGGYHYWADDVRNVTGGRGTLEYSLGDVFGIDGSRLSLGATASYDNIDRTELTGEIRLRIPLQALVGGDKEGPALSPLEERMTARVRRDLDIRLGQESAGTGGAVTRFAQDASGTELGYIYYVDGANTVGSGAADDATTLTDAITNATDVGGTTTGGFIVVDGGAGAITTTGVTLQDDQTMIGAGSSILVRLSTGAVTAYNFGGTNGTVQGTGASPVITLANNNTLAGFTILDGTSGVLGNGIADATLTGMTIGGSTGNGVELIDTTGEVTIANSLIGAIGGSGTAVGVDGVSASNVEDLAISGSSIGGGAAGSAIDVDTGAGNTALSIDGSTLATTGGVAVADLNGATGAGTLTITSLSGNTVLGGNGEDGGIVVETALLEAPGGGDAAGGDTTIGTTADRVSGSGLVLNNVDGGIAFGDLNIANTGAAGDYGLFIQDAGSGFNFGTTGGSIDSVGGTAVKIDPVTAAVTLSSITSTNADGDAIIMDRVSGAFQVTGQTTITGASGWGFFISNSDATFNFGNTTIDTPGSGGVNVEGDNSGGLIYFGQLNITGLAGGTTGVDLTDNGTPTVANMTFGSFNFSGTGGTGFDLTGSTNSGNVGATGSGSISGLDIGVDLTNAAIAGLFQFGDGSNMDGDGAASSIDATTPLVIAGMSGASGTYNFRDVQLTGDTTNLLSSQTVFYADTVGSGTGASINDRGSLADAEASGADIIILVNSNGMSADTMTVGGDGTFTLADDQDLMSFGASDTLNLTGAAPANVLLYGVSTSVINPFTGLAPTLTTATGAANTVTLGNGNIIQGLNLANTGGGAAILGNSVSTVTISETSILSSSGDGLVLQNVGGAVSIADTQVSNATDDGFLFQNVSGTLTATNSSVSGSGGSGVSIVGGSQNMTVDIDVTDSVGTGVIVNGRSGGTITYSGVINESDGVGGGVSITANTGSSVAFTNMLSLSTGTSSGVLLSANLSHVTSFSGGLNIDTTSGTGLSSSDGSDLNVAFTAGDESITTTSGTAISISGVTTTSSGIGFDSVTTDGAATGISVSGLSGAGGLTIENASLTNVTATGIVASDITTTGDFTISNISVNGGFSGVSLGGTSSATMNFGTGAGGVSIDGTTVGFEFDGAQSIVNIGTGAGGVRIGTSTVVSDYGFIFDGNSGTFNIGNAGAASQIYMESSNAAADGIHVSDSDADITFTNFAIFDPGGYGIWVDDDDGIGQFTLTGTNTIDGTGLIGVSSMGANISLSGLTLGATSQVGGRGVSIYDSGQNIVAGLTNVTVQNSASTGILIEGANGTPIILSDFSNIAVVNSDAGGVMVSNAIFDADGGADADFTGDTVSGGSLRVGQGGTVSADGVFIFNVSGDIAFDSVNVSSGGRGLYVRGSGALNAAAGTGFGLATTSGVIASGASYGVGAESLTANVTFSSITSNGDYGLSLNGVGGSFTVTGDVTVNGASGFGVSIVDSSATVLVQGTTTVTSPTVNGISLADNTGSITLGDVVISDPGGASGGVGIDVSGSNAAITFGDVSITGLGDDDTGIDLSGATLTGAVNATSVVIQGVSSTATDVENTIGVNLSGVLGNQVVNLGSQASPASGPSSSITNLETGVSISNTSSVQFTFGDGEGASDTGSSISVVSGGVTIDASGGTLGSATFDFTDVTFVGNPSFPAATSYVFVSATATNGAGDGSFANPYSVSDADAIATMDASFVFLDGTYDFATLNGGNAFSLSGNQTAQGLAFSNSVSYGITQPANVLGDFGTSLGGTVTGSGSQTFANTGNASLFDLQGNNRLSFISVDAGSLTGDAVTASSHGGAVTIDGVGASSLAASSSMFGFSNLTGGVFVQDSQVSISQGTLFDISGGTAAYTFDAGTISTTMAAGFLSTTGTATLLDVSGTTGGSITATGLSSQGTGSALLADDNDATIDFTGLSATNHSGANPVFDIDTGTGGSTGAISFDATTDFASGNTGTIFEVGAGTRNVDASAVDSILSASAGTSGHVFSITGQSAGTISFGDISFDGTIANTSNRIINATGMTGGSLSFGALAVGQNAATDAGDYVANFSGSAGSVSFDDLDVQLVSGGGLAVNGLTLAIAGTASLNSGNAQALNLTDTVINSSIMFSALGTEFGSDSTDARIVLDGVSGSGSLTATSVSIATGDASAITLADITTTGALILANVSITSHDNVSSAAAIASTGGHTATLDIGEAGGLEIDSVLSGTAAGLSFTGAHGNVNIGTGTSGLQLGASVALAEAGITLGADSTGTFVFGNASGTNVIDAGGSNTAASAIVYASSDADVTVNSVDINGAGSAASGVSIADDDTTGSFTMAGTNTIDGFGTDGISMAGGNAAIANVTIGTAGDDGIDIVDGAADTFVALSNVSVSDATGTGISLDGSTAAGTLFVSDFSGLSVNAAGAGGILADTVTFDGDTGTAGLQAVDASAAITVGVDGSNRVTGDGLRFDSADGTLNLGAINVFNDTGTGLYVDAKLTTFTLTNDVATSSIDTTNGAAMFLDPLSADLTFNTVSSTNSGSTGVTFDGVTGVGSGSNAVTISTLNVSGALLQGVLVKDSSGVFSLGNATISGGTTIGIEIDGGSSAVSFGAGSSLSQTANAAAVSVINGHTGSLTYSGSINATNGQGLQFNNADGTSYAFNGSVTLNGGTAGIDIFGGSDAAFTFSNTNITTSSDAGLVIFNANVSALTFGGSITQTGGHSAINISSATGGIHNISADISSSSGVADAITIASTGTFNFSGDLNLSTTSGDAFVMTGGTLSVTGANTSASSATGQVIDLDGTTIGASGVTFDTLTSTGTAAGSAIVLNNLGGTGTFAVTGTTSITDPTTAGILVSGTMSADVSFADLNIALASDSSTGVDFSSATVNGDFTAGDFDLTSSSSTGTVGIDLGATTGSGAIQIGDTTVGGADASIAGVNSGVLFSSTTNVSFAFGDGESGTDTGSSITATTPIDNGGGSLPSNGSYNFLDTSLTGDTSALAGASYYVVDTANTSGAGTFANPGSVTEAEAATVDVIVVVDRTVNGASTTLDLGSGAFDLDQDQILVGLVAGETFDPTAYGLGAGAPASFMLSGSFSSAIAAPNDGSIDTVDATITSSGSATVNFNTAGGSAVDGILATNTSGSASSAVLFGSQINGSATANNSTLTHSGAGHGIYLSQSAGTTFTTTFGIDNNTITTGTTLNDHAGVTVESSATTAAGVMSGTISNNTISGGHHGIYIHQFAGFNGQTTADIDSNNISNVRNGVFVDQEGVGRADLTITNNTVSSPLDVVSNGILFFVGNSTAPTVCADVTGNTLTSGSSGNSVYFDTYPFTTVILPGYAGGSTSEANVRTFVDGNNTATVNSSDIFLDTDATVVDGTCTLP